MGYNKFLMGKLNSVEAVVDLGTFVCEVSKGRVYYRVGKIGDLEAGYVEIKGCCKASGVNGICNCNLLHRNCSKDAIPLEKFASMMSGDVD